MNTAWLFAGGAALTGLVATCWSYLQSIYQYIISWLIITVTVQGYQSDALQLYLRDKFTASKYGPRVYVAWLLHVRPIRRTQLVAMEVIGNGGRLDGIQKCNGLFVAITTNQLEHIDSALGSPEDGISSRPGRIDRTLHLGPLSESARTKIASRILFDRVDLQLRAVEAGAGDTAARFQERCSRYALSDFWNSNIARDKPGAPRSLDSANIALATHFSDRNQSISSNAGEFADAN